MYLRPRCNLVTTLEENSWTIYRPMTPHVLPKEEEALIITSSSIRPMTKVNGGDMHE